MRVKATHASKSEKARYGGPSLRASLRALRDPEDQRVVVGLLMHHRDPVRACRSKRELGSDGLPLRAARPLDDQRRLVEVEHGARLGRRVRRAHRPAEQVPGQLDRRVNDAGLLRLMVPDPLAMNMSNTLPASRKQGAAAPVQKKTGGLKTQLLDFPPVKKTLLAFYDAVFRWYYDR